jgi:phosphoglycerol transferase MdoB-like AlkP superfamily enzyme
MNKIINFIIIFLWLFFIEMVFKYALFGLNIDLNILSLILFLIPISIIINIIISLLKEKVNKILFFIIVFIFTIIFIAQIVYYENYNSIFSLTFAKDGIQVFEFYNQIINSIMRNIVPIVLTIIPSIIFTIWHKKLINFNQTKIKNILIMFLIVILSHSGALLFLHIDKNSMYSNYNLYYNVNYPIITAKNMGLTTAIRLDLKRAILGFEEKTIKTDNNKPVEQVNEDPIIEYNTLDINWEELIANEQDETIKNMHTYFSNVKPTNKNKYTGIFKGKNLILVLGEAFHNIAINEEITPTLYKLANEGFVFKNFYTPIFHVSTSDGEYITTTSLLPKSGVWSMKESASIYLPFVMGNTMKKLGYKTTAYHNHSGTYYSRNKSHPNLGYDFYACKMGLNINCKRWPESDLEMINATTKDYVNNAPFLTYYITVSGHLNYTTKGNSIARQNWNVVKHLPYSDLTKGYLSCHVELDRAMEQLIKDLEATGELENTVIVMSGDHYPYGLTINNINEILEPDVDETFDMHRMPLIIWNSEMEPVIVDKLASSLDILPTLLNLFGIEYDSRLLMGRDIFSDSEPLVIYANRSWITEKGKYNSVTNEFFGGNVTDEYINNINNIVYNKFHYSTLILDRDYYRKLFNN